MRKQRVLTEARAYLLEDFVVHELDHMVDYRTGEILEARDYVTQPLESDLEPPEPSFSSLTSLHQRDAYLDRVDKRTLSRFNGCLGLYDRDKGRYFLNGTAVQLSTTTYNKIDRLVNQLDYRNLIIESPIVLAKRLGVRTDHLHRYLKSLGALVRVWGARDGMAKGTIKVAVSPAYGFRYYNQQLDTTRQDASIQWYRELMQ